MKENGVGGVPIVKKNCQTIMTILIAALRFGSVLTVVQRCTRMNIFYVFGIGYLI